VKQTIWVSEQLDAGRRTKMLETFAFMNKLQNIFDEINQGKIAVLLKRFLGGRAP